jgi:hypothetical protein
VGLRCRNPPRYFSHLKTRPIPLIETPNGQELCRPLYIFHEIFIGTTLHKNKFKYQSWYLTPYCGREVQKPTQELQSVKGPTNTFDWNPKWTRTLPFLIYVYRIFIETLLQKKIKYQSWYLTPCCGFEVQNPPRHFSELKGRTIHLIETPSGQELCRPLNIFHEIFIGTILQKRKFKYQSWYLTPYCGLEVQKHNQALQSVKGPDNTFEWNPKWERTLPSLIYVSWDIYSDLLSKKNIKISKLIFDTLLWAWGAETHTGYS